MSSTKPKNWIVARWDGNTLRPRSEYDRELLAHLKVGSDVRVEVNEFRSLKRNAFYWVILRLVVHNNEHFATPEALHKLLLVACGVTEPFITLDGEYMLIPSSTSFDKMKEDEFKAYFDKAMQIIAEKILPGVDLKLLMREADRFSGGTRKPHHPAKESRHADAS